MSYYLCVKEMKFTTMQYHTGGLFRCCSSNCVSSSSSEMQKCNVKARFLSQQLFRREDIFLLLHVRK